MGGTKQTSDKRAAAAARKARLADALKANLKRRKAQARARTQTPAGDEAAAVVTGPPKTGR